MKRTKTLSAIILTGLWVILLAIPWGNLPALGDFLSPGIGFWANANKEDTVSPVFKPLEHDSILNQVQIVLDHQLVPHIKADNDYDVYYAQGYVTAYYRLWQMDMQTRAAAGEISAVVGEAALNYDRRQRRKGMIWAAEKSVKAMQANPKTKIVLDAYTAGVNAYIKALNYKHLPLEYKLMNFKPRPWKPLYTALLLKYMADDLTGYSHDIPYTYLRETLSKKEFNILFPNKMKSSNPVIPRGTVFGQPTLKQPPVPDSNVFAHFKIDKDSSPSTAAIVVQERNNDIGSNNWALDGTKTVSGYPVLCNDPHLAFNLPSIWYEIQLTTPEMNCYGVSIPGAPAIVIGFTDSISWGLTNNYRDVKDFFVLTTDDRNQHYYFDGQWRPFKRRIEKIKVKGHFHLFVDTVKYTIQGPVEYDSNFPDPTHSGKSMAMSWIGHRGSNELLALYQLNRADNYHDYVQAVHHFECPAQNFIYADVQNNIAIWGQGQFINKWKGQGRFVMRGDTSATLWGENIPMADNPHVLNPPQHYLESANQQVTDDTYPYYYDGDFTEFRSWEITRFLSQKKKFDIQDMMALQNNNWSIIAHRLMPLFRQYGQDFGQQYPDYFANWNDTLTADTKTGAAFQIWWHFLYFNLWDSAFSNVPMIIYPSKERTLHLILNKPKELNKFTHKNLATVAKESFKQTADSLAHLKTLGKDVWYQIKNATVLHLAKIPAFSYKELPAGGSATTINAISHNHGPSWRMIVQMNPNGVKAWGVYPGGQSGNPGSAYYANFLNKWINGKYYPLKFFHEADYQKAKRSKQ